MYTINFWSKLNIFWGKITIVVFAFLLITTNVFSQYKEINNPNYDSKNLHYGFLIGAHLSKYRLVYSDNFAGSMDSLQAINSKNQAGFSIGFLASYRLSDLFEVRLMPSVGFYDYMMEYTYSNRPMATKINSKTFVELSTLVKFKSVRKRNTRAYLVAGIRPSLEVTPKTDENTQEGLDLKTMNLAFDYGFGLDYYFPLFKFSPEIRFSQGLPDMINLQNDYSRGIKKLATNSISLYLIFQ